MGGQKVLVHWNGASRASNMRFRASSPTKGRPIVLLLGVCVWRSNIQSQLQRTAKVSTVAAVTEFGNSPAQTAQEGSEDETRTSACPLRTELGFS